ncbi:hypothetical protein [Gimesia sp.]|uniref:hypothetical protein n=1 Tax=Gimesia sp. TaxID=2024833 RepID=UPI003A8EFB32
MTPRVHHLLTDDRDPANDKIVSQHMHLTSIEKALILAAYFRGGSPDDETWTSNTDQILTLSLFYSGELTAEECVRRFARRSGLQKLYTAEGELTEEIANRYQVLIQLLQKHPGLIEGNGNFTLPAHPTFTSCRLTNDGFLLAASLINRFPQKPAFPDWPDQRIMTESNS